MKKSRLVRFVGGPLHGESREGLDGKDSFQVPGEAAHALKAALGAEDDQASPPDPAVLDYQKRTDGRYWLAIPAPKSLGDPPPDFTMVWFDAGDDMNLVEIHAPESDWGHAWTEVQVSDDFLADHAVPRDEGMSVIMGKAHDSLEAKERALILQMGFKDIIVLSRMIADGEIETQTPGNRRIVAALLIELSEHRAAN